ncbi:MAG TPA: hemolysin family protein [Polyangia bacterium]|nr:hemolysin family protein [Polyangia bacterium]
MFSPSTALALAALLVAANAFFVASEFAIVKIRPTLVKELVGRGGRRAWLLSGITGHLDSFLSANQFGITLTSLALGWLGEPALAALIQPHLGSLGQWTGLAVHSLALGIGFVLISFVHAVLGELVPKAVALQKTEPVALWAAAPLRVFYLMAFPFIWTLTASANLFLRALRLRPASGAEMLHSPDELRLVLQHVDLDPGARRLIDRVFDYTHRVARHVMTLRRDVVVLEEGRPFAENVQLATANQYTRYPLVEPGSDRVIGYVHLKDIVAALAAGRTPKRMREIAREPIYCSEETPSEWLRREFQRRRVHMAVVLGAGNAFLGVVTLEDLLEEFVGEIQDEQDVGELPPIMHGAEGRFEADGRLTLDVAERELGVTLPPLHPGIETLGAYVQAHLARPLRPGGAVDLGGFRFTALEIRDGKIRRLRGEPLPHEDGGDTQEE